MPWNQCHPSSDYAGCVMANRPNPAAAARAAVAAAANVTRGLEQVLTTVTESVAETGATNMGAVLHTLNPRLFLEQIAYIANHAGDRILLADPNCADLVGQLLPQALQASVFDMQVNAGANAVKLLQRLLSRMGFACTDDGVVGPRTEAATQAGVTSDRRRLSTILNRASPDSPFRGSRISGSNCQSPRVQRCRREAATSAWNGDSSIRLMSVTTAQRASEPSKRSWLST